MEAETTTQQDSSQSKGRLNRFWWVVLVAFSSAGILLVINQLWNIQPFGFLPMGGAYYYYLIACYLPLAYILFPASRSASKDRVPWYDVLLFAVCLVTSLYFAASAWDIQSKGWELTPPAAAVFFSVVLWALVLEACRRSGGTPLTIIVGVLSMFPLATDFLPGPLKGFGFGFFETVSYHAMSLESIRSVPLRTFGDLIIGFIMFGVALEFTGAGKFFLNASSALLGHSRGGPAKVCVCASALFGTMSGSAISNIIATGTWTIPTMKRIGYPAHLSAGIEAVAATGGAIMPPVMGAVAFVMASFLGIPYSAVIIAAIMPSVLYYLVLFVQVDAYAVKGGLKGLPREDLPSFKASLKEGWFYIFSFLFLIYLLVYQMLEAQAPFYATIMLFGLGAIRKDSRLTPRRLVEFIAANGKQLVNLVAILTAVGLIVGSLVMTGVANSLSGDLLLLAGGNIVIILLLGALANAILGMGMTITACYILLAVVMAPALIGAGVPALSAHFFILYWGLASFLTPPVALSAIVAANIARAGVMKVAVASCQLGAALFIVPFFFVFNNGLLLQGEPLNMAISSGAAIAGFAIAAYSLVGYVPWLGTIKTPVRVLLVISGLLLAFPHSYTHMAGLGGTAVVVGAMYLFRRAAPVAGQA